MLYSKDSVFVWSRVCLPDKSVSSVSVGTVLIQQELKEGLLMEETPGPVPAGTLT